MWLIVGLGNPGEEYTRTRHNLGFQCVKEVAERHGLDFGKKLAKARVADAIELIVREGFTAAMNQFNRVTDDRRSDNG